ncbi:hypothetical protein BB559_005837 [Furculomyces boomerangus]|uniref:Uncharacterized protein n=2 Tax=Harpellales TaxID=61421 RepID=A0A2T9Y6B7_9FUNG|nr:hypothetical protein BB559_005837 [Furculomyces boomerangus]PVZ97580.1 hypothetical protein BB558_006456 [Smittium angustum]PWA02678.1 hypothetical protein BB558_001166 [Smittium angustum]
MCDIYGIFSQIDHEGLSYPIELATSDPELNSPLQTTDSQSSIWLRIFFRFFVEDVHAQHDDMLFFVKKDHNCKYKEDPVFVVRKPSIPHLFQQPESKIQWMESLFLNLIVQMPCLLTVSVYKKTLSNNSNNPIISLKRMINKPVYALPNRPQNKRPKSYSGPPECSWPLIYFMVDDFEDFLEEIVLSQSEFLTVELSTFISTQPTTKTCINNNISKTISKDKYLNQPNFNISKTFISSKKNTDSEPKAPTISEKKIILFKGAASFESLLDTYNKQQNNINIITRLRNNGYTTEFVKLKTEDGKSGAQIALKGNDFYPKNLESQKFDSCEKKGLKYSYSNPALRSFATEKPTNSLSLHQNIPHPPQSIYTLENHKSERSPTLLPKVTPMKSHCSHFVNTSGRRFSASPSFASLKDFHSVEPQTKRSNKNTSEIADMPHHTLIFQPPSALESLSSHISLGKTYKMYSFSRWFQKITIPIVPDGFGLSLQPKPLPESLHCFINYVYIPWGDIVRDILEAKNVVDMKNCAFENSIYPQHDL